MSDERFGFCKCELCQPPTNTTKDDTPEPPIPSSPPKTTPSTVPQQPSTNPNPTRPSNMQNYTPPTNRFHQAITPLPNAQQPQASCWEHTRIHPSLLQQQQMYMHMFPTYPHVAYKTYTPPPFHTRSHHTFSTTTYCCEEYQHSRETGGRGAPKHNLRCPNHRRNKETKKK